MAASNQRIFSGVNEHDAVPAFQQLVSQFVAALAAERARVGDRLPTVRALAAELALAPNTVAKSYRELESLGLIETRGRNGTFVSTVPGMSPTRAAAARAARHYVETCARLGFTANEAVEFVAQLRSASTESGASGPER